MQNLSVPRNALVANVAATNATTNLVCASLNAPANTLAAGQVWKFRGELTFLHTAAATPTITVELAVAGTAIVSLAVVPPSTATTFSGWVEGFLTVRSVGSSGTVAGSVHLRMAGTTQANDWGGSLVDTSPDTVNTTIARLVELRVRMTTAVASNTLTLAQGWVEQLVG